MRKVTEVWLGGGEERPKGWVIGYRDCNTFVRTGVRTSPSPFVGEELHSCVCGNLQLLHPVCRLCSGPLRSQLRCQLKFCWL